MMNLHFCRLPVEGPKETDGFWFGFRCFVLVVNSSGAFDGFVLGFSERFCIILNRL